MATYIADHQMLFAIVTGLLPSLVWLFFWLRIGKAHPEPWGILLLCFILGAASVMVATAIQRGTLDILGSSTMRIWVWAGIEEVLKFIVFYIVAYRSDYDKEALDPALYMITIALGFAALENILYVLHPQISFNVTTALLTGGLRFFGSTLLHTIASCIVGIAIAYSPRNIRPLGMILGLFGAVVLHGTFNFFILKNDTASFLHVYAYLWVAAIISHIILEKVRRLPSLNNTAVRT